MNMVATIILLAIGAFWGSLLTFAVCAWYAKLKVEEGSELAGFPFDPSSKHPCSDNEKERVA